MEESMGIKMDREMRRFVAACIAGSAEDRQSWDDAQKALWTRLRVAGLVTRDGEVLTALYSEAIAEGVLQVLATFKIDAGELVFAVYGAVVHGYASTAVSISDKVRRAVAIGLATGRFVAKHSASGGYEVVAR
jgi:hypothetical protein